MKLKQLDDNLEKQIPEELALIRSFYFEVLHS